MHTEVGIGVAGIAQDGFDHRGRYSTNQTAANSI